MGQLWACIVTLTTYVLTDLFNVRFCIAFNIVCFPVSVVIVCAMTKDICVQKKHKTVLHINTGIFSIGFIALMYTDLMPFAFTIVVLWIFAHLLLGKFMSDREPCTQLCTQEENSTVQSVYDVPSEIVNRISTIVED